MAAEGEPAGGDGGSPPANAESVQVAVRVRPLDTGPGEVSSLEVVPGPGIELEASGAGPGVNGNAAGAGAACKRVSCSYDRVFGPEASQEEVFGFVGGVRLRRGGPRGRTPPHAASRPCPRRCGATAGCSRPPRGHQLHPVHVRADGVGKDSHAAGRPVRDAHRRGGVQRGHGQRPRAVRTRARAGNGPVPDPGRGRAAASRCGCCRSCSRRWTRQATTPRAACCAATRRSTTTRSTTRCRTGARPDPLLAPTAPLTHGPARR